MRSKNSFINIMVGCVSYVIIMLGSFLSRGAFARILGLEYVGVESTFVSITSMLAIVELGIGTGIIYKLYKPIAEKNTKEIIVILKFIKRAYQYIASIVFVLGVIIAFYVGDKFQEGNFSRWWLSSIFIFYVLDIMASYLFAYKRSMLLADQKNHINNTIHMTVKLFLYVLQILSLYMFKSFLIYIVLRVICRLLENIIISIAFNKRYPDIKLNTNEKMPLHEQKDMILSLRALLMHMIAGASLNSASSIIIKQFINFSVAGIYGNYMLISNALINVSNEFFNGIIASFGNLLSTEKEDKIYNNFKMLYLVNFFIYSFFATSLFNLVNPFMTLWIGKKGLFPVNIVLAICIYVFMYGMRQSLMIVKCGAGIYRQDRYFAILEAIISITLSVVLVQKVGVIGVILSSIISMTLIPMWTQPYLVYKIVFHKPLKTYYFKYLLYLGLTALYVAVVYYICSLFNFDGIMRLFTNAVVCLIVPNLCNILIFRKTKEFEYLYSLFKAVVTAIKGKIHTSQE